MPASLRFWEPPRHEVVEFSPRRTRYCFIVVTLNEGERIRAQLGRMRAHAALADIIIADGKSTDGSLSHDFVREQMVRTLLLTDEGGLSTATRMGIAYAIEQGYEGVITVDGNGKDGVEALPHFISELEGGGDLIQGSRFMPGGYHKNTPLERWLGIKLVMAPLMAIGSGHYYSDPTNGFRAMSMRFLTDARVEPVRKVFVRFNIQHYFNYRAAKLGFKVKEIPVRRCYPDEGPIPTKIHGLPTKLRNVWEMVVTVCGGYNPGA
jgi:dolichol-phosphate mannosyltransferase